MDIRKTTFVVFFYNLIIYSLLLLGVVLFVIGYFISESFIVKLIFISGKHLTREALDKIDIFRTSLMAAGLLLFALPIFFVLFKGSVLNFIKKRKVLLQNITLLLSIIIIFVILLEFSMRLAISEEMKYSFFVGRSDFYEKFILFNEDGYREKDYPYSKEKDTARIVGLGDSFTLGLGVKNVDDTYLKVLEKTLNENSENRRYEVLNFGKNGIDTEGEINILRNKAILYNPDIIIVGYVLNDFRDLDEKRGRSNFYLYWFNYCLKSKSYVYYFSGYGFERLMEYLGFKKTYTELIEDSFKSERNRQFNKEYFRELAEISRDNNATLIIVIFPFIYNLNDYPFVDMNDFIKQSAEEYGLIVLDLLPYYKVYDEEELFVSKYDLHPNELAHNITANAIYEMIK